MQTMEDTKQDNIWHKAIQVFESQVEAIIRESKLYHQEVKNINGCGASVESFVRDFLITVLPSRFKLRGGYIAVPLDNGEPIISPHMDIVITDSLVPDSLLPFSSFQGLSVIPYESVVGIVEVKRTLTKEVFKEAFTHLQKCWSNIDYYAEEFGDVMLGGLKTKVLKAYTWNPFLSVMSVRTDLSENDKVEIKEMLCSSEGMRLSFVASLDGFYIGPEKNGAPTAIENKQGDYDYRKAEGKQAIEILLKHLHYHLRQTAGVWPDFNKYWINGK